jgi:hypothetical protein
MPKA